MNTIGRQQDDLVLGACGRAGDCACSGGGVRGKVLAGLKDGGGAKVRGREYSFLNISETKTVTLSDLLCNVDSSINVYMQHSVLRRHV